MDDILTLEQKLGRGIATVLNADLGTGGAGTTPDPEAYQLYLRGRYHLNKYHQSEMPKAIETLKRSVAKQNDFSLAYAALAESYAFMDHVDLLPPVEAYRLSTEAAARAIELDPEAAEAWAALGHVQMHEGKFQQAGGSLRRAIEVSPNSSIARQWNGMLLQVTGRPGWRNEFERSIDLDPFSTQVLIIFSRRLQDLGDYTGALHHNERAVRLDPNQSNVHKQLARSHALAGNTREAAAAISRARELALDTRAKINVDLEEAFVAAMAGDRVRSLELLRRNEAHVAADAAQMPILMVRAYSALGEVDEAIAWCGKMVEHNPWYARLNLFLPPHPAFDPVRADPRWQRLRNMLGLPPEQFTSS
jgi:tetratricopeptide (TPR) repeat protein